MEVEVQSKCVLRMKWRRIHEHKAFEINIIHVLSYSNTPNFWYISLLQ